MITVFGNFLSFFQLFRFVPCFQPSVNVESDSDFDGDDCEDKRRDVNDNFPPRQKHGFRNRTLHSTPICLRPARYPVCSVVQVAGVAVCERVVFPVLPSSVVVVAVVGGTRVPYRLSRPVPPGLIRLHVPCRYSVSREKVSRFSNAPSTSLSIRSIVSYWTFPSFSRKVNSLTYIAMCFLLQLW